jgi:predicted phosphoribosyltransferase
MAPDALFADRVRAGAALAERLAPYAGESAVAVGLARGGVVVAAEVARALGLPLDALAVRKITHPLRLEYALGAATPFAPPHVRARDGLDDRELAEAVERARREAAALDRILHPLGDARRAWSRVLLIDDGVATGATMTAAVLWARSCGAHSIVAAAPVITHAAAAELRLRADAVVAVYELAEMHAVGLCYDRFPPVGTEEVLGLLGVRQAVFDGAA